ncbi:MAG: acetyl-CoA carboxylase, carboxyltransferase subunit beta [Fidelibacterota bacterium]
MDWFKRVKKGIFATKKKEMPDGIWLKCNRCTEIIYRKELEKNYFVCSKCSYHFRIGSNDYIKILIDDGQFEEFNSEMQSVDPLKFKSSKKYSDQLKNARKVTGLKEAVRTIVGRIHNREVVVSIMDFSFIGGSMGSVVGEKISRAIDLSLEKHIPLVIISSSGGARMQEGALSLMQMAKTSAKLSRHSEEGLLYISILTDPTTGGVTASYAMLGDIIIAEPGALIGFAGPRVIKQTIGQDLPEGFQRAEFLLEKGFIDMIVDRKDLKRVLGNILDFFE